MDWVGEIAKQGFGYLLFAASLIVIFFLYRENKQLSSDKVELANKRVEDLKVAQDAYTSALSSQTKIAENTFTIVQNLQSLLNNLKQI